MTRNGINASRTRTRLLTFLLATAPIVAITGCGDDTVEPMPTEPPVPTTVTIAPTSTTLRLPGATVRLIASVQDQYGQPMSGVAVTWTSSDASVASVDSAGVVSAIAIGTAMVTARAGSASGSAEVIIEEHPDWGALTLLYGATRGEGWVNNHNWLTDAPLGRWYGVNVNTSGRVAQLNLPENGLAGVIPPELGRLTDLSSLVLADNQLTGPIPTELGGLGKLSVLKLERNYLDNPIPVELGGLTGLREVDLRYNQLTGAIPSELGRLHKLRSLYLAHNELTGVIPSALGDLGELWYMDLGGNALTGPIPPELGNLAELRLLWLDSNSLTGAIPSELGKPAHLGNLHLHSNKLTGPIPPELGNLAELGLLWLHSNNLSGAIPPELGNLSELEGLNLSSNQLSGSLPTELGKLTNLIYMKVYGNELTGGLPTSFLGLSNLEDFLIEYGGATNHGLCVPATDQFRNWARRVAARGHVDRSPSPFCDEIDRRALETLYEGGNGSRWTRSDAWLDDEDLGRWYGVRTDSLGRVSGLDLTSNGLSGYVPEQMGRLAQLTELRIGQNELAGRLPLSLIGLPLDGFDYGGTSLCVADDADFLRWLNGIPRHTGTGVQCPPLTEREILEWLYRNTDGPNWGENRGWLTDAPLSEWHGVHTDAAGRVVALNLSSNGLSGPLPAELAQLPELRQLLLAGNDLTGPVPRTMGDLGRLEWLDLAWNDLGGTIPGELGRLSALRRLRLGANTLSGPIPPELGDLDRLEHLSLGRNQLSGAIPGELSKLYTLRSLHLGRNALAGAVPPELGNLDHLEELRLGSNQLTGEIPAALGRMSALRILELADNSLSGPIPPALGGLDRLERLLLGSNELTGGIPGELGALAVLERMDLADNRLSGSLPVELGKLVSLVDLGLAINQLSGPVPTELGGLQKLTGLDLGDNQLTGSLPAGLGRAVNLENLDLRANALTGPVPAEFGNLTRLKSLILADNPALDGPLPPAMTKLERLDRLMAGGTGLCRPADRGFDVWFGRIADRRLVRCEGGAAVYLTQSVQSWDDPVPLLAGKPALLRVFVTAPGGTATMPDVKATFYVDGSERHTVRIAAGGQSIPTDVAEGNLASSANADIPGRIIAPGLEMVIHVDLDGQLDAALGVTKRIPETGRMPVDVRTVPPFHLMLVPFVWQTDPDPSVRQFVAEMAADPEGHELLRDVRALLPIAEFSVAARDPVITSTTSPWKMIAEVGAVRAMEGGSGHWMGIFGKSERRATNWPLGVAQVGGYLSVSEPIAGTMAHELGHNMGLLHAPCACAGTDPWFPHPGGRIGVWGYDAEQSRLVPPDAADVMSYCKTVYWISDFFFNKALNHRLAGADAASLAEAEPVRTLLLWGGRDERGVPYLDPAFVVDAVPSLPRAGGEYAIQGITSDGTPLFSLPFDMPANPDAQGKETSFMFALPAQPAWAGNLTSITLSGPDGSVTLDGESDRPMAILRDPRTGQVRGFLRDLPAAAVQTVAGGATEQGAGPKLEVLFSRGIPDAAAWRR